MSEGSLATQACSVCGFAIPAGDFAAWGDMPTTTYAVCGHCGSANSQPLRPATVLNMGRSVPWPVTDVYPLVSQGWRATCECGRTLSVDDEVEGWRWVVNHPCAIAQP